MAKLREWLKGKKTYLVAVAAVVASVIAYAEEVHDFPEMVKLIVAALLASTLRAGVGNGK